MEYFENTVANNAGIAKRAIERLLEAITNGGLERSSLDRSSIGQLEEVLDTLTLLHAKNNDPLEDELKPKGWQEAANTDGYLFNEYHEYDSLTGMEIDRVTGGFKEPKNYNFDVVKHLYGKGKNNT